MEARKFVFQWVVMRKNLDEKFGISLNFDERINQEEVASIAEKSIAAEKNHSLEMYPSTHNFTLQTDDIIEAVNQKVDIDEMQKELQTALSVELQVRRTKLRYVF